MNKIALQALMAVAICVVAFMCYRSIQKPIEFEAAKEKRQAAVVAKLIDIRQAEVYFKDVNGHYTSSFDSLKTFIKTGQKLTVKKQGTITDQQLEKGLTELKAWKMVRDNKGEDAAKYGIEDFEAFCQYFRRDTMPESVLEIWSKAEIEEATKLGRTVTTPIAQRIDNIDIVPMVENTKFELQAVNLFNDKSGVYIPLFQAQVSNDNYLMGLERQEIVNMNKLAKDLEKYPGLRVGDITEPNNNAGNWE
ncbi:MAG: hypothetical protein MJZ24_00575 [Paludibacteraceae bacterium]|nr:hypothetical protein [Candidatus Physcocola equi]MCQ2233218.1 hypothetical protein [Paludibacteraceae bacterium]